MRHLDDGTVESSLASGARGVRLLGRVRSAGTLRLIVAAALMVWGPLGCGGRASVAPPQVIVSVSVSTPVLDLTNDGSSLYIPVVVVAPTETASFAISGLPAGVSASYKESESNPSGQLTLTAAPATLPGTYIIQLTVGSSGQTASTSFMLTIQAAAK